MVIEDGAGAIFTGGDSMYNREKIFIGGEWKRSTGNEFIDIVNPATEEVIGRIPSGTSEDVDAAVDAARRAFKGWAALSGEDRAQMLSRLHQGLQERENEIARAITEEMGMPFKLSRKIQAALPITVMKSYAELAASFQKEEEIGNSRVVMEPVGVIGCITPWNYPLHQVVAKVAPALAAGCTVVLKPSELAPLTAFILAEISAEAQLPPGVFNLVSGYGQRVGEALATHPGIDMISFTGSLQAGKRVAELAARSVKRVTLELGGKSPSVILEDADLEKAVKNTVSTCFLNSGQTCNALTRMLVPEAFYETASKLAVETAQSFLPGDPLDEKTRLGPLASRAQQERVREFIRKGIEEGAELLLGGPESPEGTHGGFYVKPTVFGKVTPEMTIAREEIFGPVLSILPYDGEEEAVRMANDSIYGLAAAVWSNDQARALKVAGEIRAGQIDINGGRYNPMAPFGGFKQSGYGRELGKFGMEEFLEKKSYQL
jgi:acyl-CoA reductase-like NAD-dependent aldehyde dehydrogenase